MNVLLYYKQNLNVFLDKCLLNCKYSTFKLPLYVIEKNLSTMRDIFDTL